MEEIVNDPNRIKEMFDRYEKLSSEEKGMVLRAILRHCLEPFVEPRFVCKCTKCGAEYQVKYKECQECGSTELREPDPNQIDDLLAESWRVANE